MNEFTPAEVSGFLDDLRARDAESARFDRIDGVEPPARCAHCGLAKPLEQDATGSLSCETCYVPDITGPRYRGLATEDVLVAPPNAKDITPLRPVAFTFDDERAFPGVTDDTDWNGFLNVRVTPETLAAIVAYMAEVEPGSDANDPDNWPAPGEDGLVDLSGGYATSEFGRFGDRETIAYDAPLVPGERVRFTSYGVDGRRRWSTASEGVFVGIVEDDDSDSGRIVLFRDGIIGQTPQTSFGHDAGTFVSPTLEFRAL